MKRLLIPLILLLFLSCQSEDRSNPRAYVEGKIADSRVEFALMKVKLKNENSFAAEVIPSDNGEFILSGPLRSENFSVIFDSKVASFKSSKSGCFISKDSMEILIPTGTTYITFSEIKLK